MAIRKIAERVVLSKEEDPVKLISDVNGAFVDLGNTFTKLHSFMEDKRIKNELKKKIVKIESDAHKEWNKLVEDLYKELKK